jgi:hypothetical protein
MLHEVQAFMNSSPEKDDETCEPMDQEHLDMMTRKFGLVCVWLTCYDFVGTFNKFFSNYLHIFILYGSLFNLYSLDLTNFKENIINNLLLGLLVLKSRYGVTVALSPAVNRPFMLQVVNESDNLFLWLQEQIPLVNIPLLS